MNTGVNGWCGKILFADLSVGRLEEKETAAYAALFLGGRGVATGIYRDTVDAATNAFDPENHLIFMTGPLGATGAQGASRFVVAGKSPMRQPEGFCIGNLGGYFGPYLKKAGFDGLVIRGASEKPVYLWIEDGRAEIRDAGSLWGQGVYAVKDRLKADYGKTVRYIAAGVAGENLCRSATIMTDNEGSGTGGFGAVMGSKKLKAVVVSGKGSPGVADPDRLRELNKEAVRLSRRDPMFLPFPPDRVSREGKASCYQCGMDCAMRNTLRTASGKTLVRKCQSMFVYFPWVMSRPDEPAENALEATGICNDLGLCTMEMANIIQWLSNCHQSGSEIPAESGLDMSALGTLSFFEKLAGMIARREGLGDLLAEGLLRAGERLGEKATRHFPNEAAGVGDGATYSAREYPMNGLLYAFEPRQPIAMLHEVSRLVGLWVDHQGSPDASPVDNDVFRAAAARFWGHEAAWDLTTHEGKARAAMNIMDRTLVKDSLMLCDSVWPIMVSWHTPDRVGDPTMESRMFSAVTGMDIDEAGLNHYGERIFNLQRAVMLREGWRPKTDDALKPFNFKDPVQSVFMNPEVIVPGKGDSVVSKKGATISREAFEAMRDEFYTLRGWDPASGCQRKETLAGMGLGFLVDEIDALGLLMK